MAKRKTPPALARVIMERQPDVIAHLEEMLRVKRTYPADQQADHVRNRTEAEMVAFVNGYNACLEAVMHEFNCYAGFHNYGPVVKNVAAVLGNSPALVSQSRHSVAPSHPDYLEWRKLYYTNGIAKA